MKDLTGEKFGEMFVVERDQGSGNNIKYIVRCKCGELFSVHAFRLRDLTVTCCPACRKLRIKQKQKGYRAARLIVGQDYPCDAIKYTLMDLGKTKILQGTMGKHIFFDKKKARIATRSVASGAIVVPLQEAEAIEKNA